MSPFNDKSLLGAGMLANFAKSKNQKKSIDDMYKLAF
jgi:hypothetical protein